MSSADPNWWSCPYCGGANSFDAAACVHCSAQLRDPDESDLFTTVAVDNAEVVPPSVPFGPDFPLVAVRDWVKVQAQVSDHLGIPCWAAVPSTRSVTTSHTPASASSTTVPVAYGSGPSTALAASASGPAAGATKSPRATRT